MTTNNTTTATTPNAPRTFDENRTHNVGQFLRANPLAAKVMASMRGNGVYVGPELRCISRNGQTESSEVRNERAGCVAGSFSIAARFHA
jgi:hypothetical protein